MAGIPTHCSERFFETLQKKGYYIIVIEQTGPAASGGFKREVTQIITPGTILKLRNSDSNYLMNIYITEHIDKYDKTFLYYAVSIIDVTTGKIYLYDDKNVYNFIHSKNISQVGCSEVCGISSRHHSKEVPEAAAQPQAAVRQPQAKQTQATQQQATARQPQATARQVPEQRKSNEKTKETVMKPKKEDKGGCWYNYYDICNK